MYLRPGYCIPERRPSHISGEKKRRKLAKYHVIIVRIKSNARGNLDGMCLVLLNSDTFCCPNSLYTKNFDSIAICSVI